MWTATIGAITDFLLQYEYVNLQFMLLVGGSQVATGFLGGIWITCTICQQGLEEKVDGFVRMAEALKYDIFADTLLVPFSSFELRLPVCS